MHELGSGVKFKALPCPNFSEILQILKIKNLKYGTNALNRSKIVVILN